MRARAQSDGAARRSNMMRWPVGSVAVNATAAPSLARTSATESHAPGPAPSP